MKLISLIVLQEHTYAHKHNHIYIYIATNIDFHVLIEAVIKKKIVGHANTVRLHGVACTVIIIAHLAYG